MAARLNLCIDTYWHPGTGRGSTFHLDAVTHTGADGLPRLPGRTLKGLLRDALWRAECWGWGAVPDGTTVALFGSSAIHRKKPASGPDATAANPAAARPAGLAPRTPAADPDQRLSTAGLLRVSDATLPAETAAWLTSQDHSELIPGLYREHFSTAIESSTGVASGRSLRGMRVVVPLLLQALIEPVSGRNPVADWQARLTAVLPLVSAVGAYRSRGFGRVRLAWAPEGLA